MAPRPRRRFALFIYPSKIIFAGIAALFLTFFIMCLFLWPSEEAAEDLVHRFPRHLETNEIVLITKDSKNGTERNSTCTFHTCVNVYHCGYNDETKISVYIYPIKDYVNENSLPVATSMSREFAQILQAIAESPFYTSDSETACIFVPSIDLLNQNNIFTKEVGKVLASLPW